MFRLRISPPNDGSPSRFLSGAFPCGGACLEIGVEKRKPRRIIRLPGTSPVWLRPGLGLPRIWSGLRSSLMQWTTRRSRTGGPAKEKAPASNGAFPYADTTALPTRNGLGVGARRGVRIEGTRRSEEVPNRRPVITELHKKKPRSGRCDRGII
jgi:hypothetical protein